VESVHQGGLQVLHEEHLVLAEAPVGRGVLVNVLRPWGEGVLTGPSQQEAVEVLPLQERLQVLQEEALAEPLELQGLVLLQNTTRTM
jgi:hypothetical protein